MKNTKKFTSMLLTISMILTLLAAFCVPTAAADNAETDVWELAYKDDIATKYPGVFSYVVYNKTGNAGTVGWHTRVKDGYKYIYKEGDSVIYSNAPWDAASVVGITYSNWHYELGWAFTAPKSGVVEFTFVYFANTAYAWQQASASGQARLWITSNEPGAYVRTNGDYSCEGALASFAPLANTDAAPTANEERKVSLEVVEGVTYYFVQSNMASAENQAFWNYPVKAEYESAAAEIAGHGLASTENLLVRFFVDYEDELSDAYTATATVNGATVELTATHWIDAEGTYGNICTAEDYVYYYTVPMNAKQMTDDITFTVTFGGSTVVCTDTYSVEDYCNYYIDLYQTDGSNDAVAKACASMLLYGRMTQLALNYKTDALPQIDAALLNDIINAAD